MADPHAELSPLEAYQRVLGFAAERGENALRLALHAAIPQVLRPELLHLLRLNFVPESLDDAATEADVLFAPFCAELGNDYYRFDANARLHLLTQLDPAYTVDAVPRSRQVAGFLLAWCERQGSPLAAEDDLVFAAFLDVERWVALAFFEPDAAAVQLAAAVKQASEGGAVAARIRIGGLASTLATPLAGHVRLLAYAAGLEALELVDMGRAEDLLEPLGDREVRVGEITLRSPLRMLEGQLRRRTTLTPKEQTLEKDDTAADAPNPFYADSREPLGREEETRRIQTKLRAGNHCSIVGPPGSGKSLLLNAIQHDIPSWLACAPQAVFLIHFRDITGLKELWEHIVHHLGGSRVNELRSLLRHKPLRLLILDDLGGMDPGERGHAMRRWLRGLDDSAGTKLLMVSNERLNVLFRKDYPSPDSPLAGLDPTPIELGPLSVETCRRLVALRLEGTGLDPALFSDLFQSPRQPGDLLHAAAARYEALVNARR